MEIFKVRLTAESWLPSCSFSTSPHHPIALQPFLNVCLSRKIELLHFQFTPCNGEEGWYPQHHCLSRAGLDSLLPSETCKGCVQLSGEVSRATLKDYCAFINNNFVGSRLLVLDIKSAKLKAKKKKKGKRKTCTPKPWGRSSAIRQSAVTSLNGIWKFPSIKQAFDIFVSKQTEHSCISCDTATARRVLPPSLPLSLPFSLLSSCCPHCWQTFQRPVTAAVSLSSWVH